MRAPAVALALSLAGAPAWAQPQTESPSTPVDAAGSTLPEIVPTASTPPLPTTPAPDTGPTDAQAKQVLVELRSLSGPLTFYEHTRNGPPKPLCDAPCSRLLPLGVHKLAVSPPGEDAQLAGEITLHKRALVEGEFASLRAYRWAGWGLLAATVAASTALYLPSKVACKNVVTQTHCETYHPHFNYAFMLGLFGGAISTAMILVDDHAAVRSTTP